MFRINIVLLTLFLCHDYCTYCVNLDICTDIKDSSESIERDKLDLLARVSVPDLYGRHKGESGRIGIIGGSAEYTGAPYFSAISSLKMGADLVYVITTETAAPVIKSYSPDLIVYPYLHQKLMNKINNLLPTMDLVVIGPGLGRENDTVSLVNEILYSCKELSLPLVIDADGLYVVAKNLKTIRGYLRPGVILTPNYKEKQRLLQELDVNDTASATYYWGPYVSILEKGQEDSFTSFYRKYNWRYSLGGSSRRAGGQGDILSGILGTFFNWAIKAKLCENDNSDNLAASVASLVASNITRLSNEKSYDLLGRSMLASDMINQIHVAFEDIFGRT